MVSIEYIMSDCHLTIYPSCIGLKLTMYCYKWPWLTDVNCPFWTDDVAIKISHMSEGLDMEAFAPFRVSKLFPLLYIRFCYVPPVNEWIIPLNDWNDGQKRVHCIREGRYSLTSPTAICYKDLKLQLPIQKRCERMSKRQSLCSHPLSVNETGMLYWNWNVRNLKVCTAT